MGSYPVFNAVAPNIDVRLFGEAAEAGARLGKAIPSTATSVVTGIEQGLQYGQEYAIRESEVQKAQAQADIAKSQAMIQQSTEADQLLATKDQLEYQAKKSEDNLALTKLNDEFFSQMQTASPEEQAQIVLSGKYAQVFAAQPQLFNQQLKQLYFDPANGLDQATKDRIGNVLQVRQATDYRERQANLYLDKFNGAKEVLTAQPYIGQAVSMLGITPEQAAKDVELVPHGSLVTTADGNYVQPDIKAGGWVKSEKFDPVGARNSYDAIYKPTGQVIDGTGSIGKDTFTARQNYNTYKGMVDGSYLQKDIEHINTKPVQQKNSAAVNVPGFKSATETPPAWHAPMALPEPHEEIGAGIASAVHMDPAKFTENAKGALEALTSQIKTYVNDPKARGSAEFMKQHTDTVNTLTRTVTNDQFQNSPTLQAQYTVSHVEEYNKALLASLATNRPFFSWENVTGGFNEAVRLWQGRPAIADAFWVDTPEDLYYVKQRPVVEAAINTYVNQLVTRAEQQKASVGNTQRASKATISFLAGVAQNGPAR